jgi:NTE family protein
MYAQMLSADAVEDRIRSYFASDRYRDIARQLANTRNKAASNPGILDRMFTFVKQTYMVKRAFSELGLLDPKILESALRSVLDDEDIRDTKIPFAAVATDLWKGEDVVLRRGPVRRAVAASASIPGTFPPVELDGRYLVDGCVINMVPCHETRELGADRVVAVDVTRELVRTPSFKNGLEIMFRADEITNFQLNQVHLGCADVVIRPKMGDTHWASFDRFDEIVRKGEEAAEAKLHAVRAILKPMRRRWFWFFRRSRG